MLLMLFVVVALPGGSYWATMNVIGNGYFGYTGGRWGDLNLGGREAIFFVAKQLLPY